MLSILVIGCGVALGLLLCVVLSYWVIRLAVRDALQDADGRRAAGRQVWGSQSGPPIS